MRTLAIISLLTLPASPVLAQIDATPEPDPIYHVEIIVYALSDGNRSEEDFRHGEADGLPAPRARLYRLPDIELESVARLGVEEDIAALEAAANQDDAAATDRPGGATDFASSPVERDGLELIDTRAGRGTIPAAASEDVPEGFRLLAADELQLNDIHASMNRLRAYTVLGHAGWAQAGVDTDRSVALDLDRLGITNPSGTIEVDLRRFLRALVDFEFFDGGGSRWSGTGGAGLAPLRYAESFRLQAERSAIRVDEIHYIDHPLYGVLIQIRRAPDPETDADAGNRPAG